MALWGALVKPSAKDTSCKFIVNQLASSLLTATGNLTSSLGNTLGGILNLGGKKNVAPVTPDKSGVQTNQVSNKQTDKKSSAADRGSGGLLGIL